LIDRDSNELRNSEALSSIATTMRETGLVNENTLIKDNALIKDNHHDTKRNTVAAINMSSNTALDKENEQNDDRFNKTM